MIGWRANWEKIPTEIRIKNFLKNKERTYKSITGYTYEIGEYETSLRKALEVVNYTKWRREQREERSKNNGRLFGLGICTYLEISAWAPGFPQTASITITQTGSVKIVSGTSPHGQGHETPLAQIAADELGIDIDRIEVTYGDTDRLAWGSTTGGSRSGALGGSAVTMSARKIKQKMARIAAKELGVDPIRSFSRMGKSLKDSGEEIVDLRCCCGHGLRCFETSGRNGNDLVRIQRFFSEKLDMALWYSHRGSRSGTRVRHGQGAGLCGGRRHRRGA